MEILKANGDKWVFNRIDGGRHYQIQRFVAGRLDHVAAFDHFDKAWRYWTEWTAK